MGICYWGSFSGIELAGNKLISQQDRDRNDVIGHRRPGRGAKDVLGVEHCLEQRKQAIEEDLREQQIGKTCCLRGVDLAGFRQHHLHQLRREDNGQQGDSPQQRDCQGEQSSYEGFAVVGVFLFRTHQHWDHKRGQHGAEDDFRNQVG